MVAPPGSKQSLPRQLASLAMRNDWSGMRSRCLFCGVGETKKKVFFLAFRNCPANKKRHPPEPKEGNAQHF